jgi:hypothetical protein
MRSNFAPAVKLWLVLECRTLLLFARGLPRPDLVAAL